MLVDHWLHGLGSDTGAVLRGHHTYVLNAGFQIVFSLVYRTDPSLQGLQCAQSFSMRSPDLC